MTIVRDIPPLLPPPPPPEQAGSDNFIIDPQRQLQPNNYNGPPSSAASAVHSVATLSSPWEYDDLQPFCSNCRESFNPINRRHHCRLCGKIFCNNCSNQRSLIPPSSIVLVPDHGKKAKPPQYRGGRNNNDDGTPAASFSFSPDQDPDRMLTFMDENQQVLYGKGLEERFKLAREPLRVCRPCQGQLEPVQEELRNANSNAMRFNHIDPTDARRLFNSPLAFTLGHEIRKAAYTLNNLLPLPKRMGNIIDLNTFVDSSPSELQQCKDECSSLSPTLGNLDGVKIPARLLQQAKGVAVLTVAKGGFGIAGIEFGTGLVVARLGDHWSAPCAIGVGGLSWGALIGAQVSDHVFLLMTDASVELLFSNSGSVQLGADVGVAVGPLGRALEADFGAAPGSVAPIYTYSLSKGLYAGISLDGKVVVTRDRVNERFYGRTVSGTEILQGLVPTPPAARPLYEALQRCHVYATDGMALSSNRRSSMDAPPSSSSYPHPMQTNNLYAQQPPQPTNFDLMPPGMALPKTNEMEYGELPEPIHMYPPAANDQHSYAGLSHMSDMTSDPGY